MSEMGTAMIGTAEAMVNSPHCTLPKRRLPILWLATLVIPPKRFAVERADAIALIAR
jgi:hypothetical protein